MAKGIKFKMYNQSATRERILNNNALGLYTAELWAKEMDEYVPMDTGMLAQNYITEPFKVIYTSIYAHRQWSGTNFNFSKEMHENATSHWERATYDAKKNKISREITAYIKRS